MNNQKNEINFDFAPNVKIGSVFSRIDRNGKKWIAEVINRTEYFVDVKKIQPYKRKIVDDFFTTTKYYGGQKHTRTHCLTHEEDAEPTFERAQIIEEYTEIETGEIGENIWGKYAVKKRVPSGKFYIKVKEEYSKFSNYDKVYSLEC